jgi:two-component system NtrC family sensor kinase
MIAGINAGADDYVTKSADFEVLKARLRAQLRRKQFEDENRRIREQLIHKEVEAAEARAARTLADTRAVLLTDLEAKNYELEAFSYSVSHDLRAPLRAINGFTQALREDYSSLLPESGKMYLDRVCGAARRMGELIDDLLELSRVTRAELRFENVDLSALAVSVSAEFARKEPERQVELVISPGMRASGDTSLLHIVVENLLGNAWKYTGKRPKAKIEFGRTQHAGVPAFFVRDDGAGFNMAYKDKLFAAFQRLHTEKEFPGTGIGLATIRRIVQRHGGKVWAEGEVGKGAVFYFTLPEENQNSGLARGDA